MDAGELRLRVLEARRGAEAGMAAGAERNAAIAARFPCRREERVVATEAGRTRALFTYPEPPRAGPPPCGAPPVYINLHGSGYILGRAEVDDPWCHMITARSGVAVANVDYAKAPERPFPEAIEEVYALAARLAAAPGEFGIAPGPMAIGGHSAGAAIATAVCLLAKRRGGPEFALQILDYPPLDLATDPGDKTEVPPGAPVIPPEAARIFNAAYLRRPVDAFNILASPILAGPEELRGLPRALVFTGGLDSLWAEGRRYAENLRAAGVEVRYRHFENCAHGFSHDPAAPKEAVDELWDSICSALSEALGPPR
jgi:acetyl esterase